MQTLPKRMIQVVRLCEAVFRERVWEWANVLLIGAILTPGERTVAAIVRLMGCSDEKPFQNDHRVLNRATWSSRERSRLLLALLVRLCVAGNEPVIMGIDETIERRRGRTRGLSRSRAFEQGVLCENEWRALDVPDAAGPHPLGKSGVGLALCDCVGSLGAIP
jgi:hypothetical protein